MPGDTDAMCRKLLPGLIIVLGQESQVVALSSEQLAEQQSKYEDATG
jgi:hypothetical protein